MQWKLSLAVVAFAVGCASTPKPAPTPPPTQTPAPRTYTSDEIIQRCKAYAAGCSITYVEGRISLISHYSNTNDLADRIKSVAREAGAPFCAQSNRAGIAARVYAHVFYSGSKYLDCQTDQISEWEKDPPPGPIPPHITKIGEICKYVQDDSSRPFYCKITNSNGMVTLQLESVVPAADAAPYLDDIEKNLGKPFCNASIQLGQGGLIDVQFPWNGRGFRYNCEMGLSAKPYVLTPKSGTSAPATAPTRNTTTL